MNVIVEYFILISWLIIVFGAVYVLISLMAMDIKEAIKARKRKKEQLARYAAAKAERERLEKMCKQLEIDYFEPFHISQADRTLRSKSRVIAY